MFEGVDRPRQRPFEPTGELGRGAWFSDVGEHRFDGAIVGGSVAVKRVGRAASGMTGRVPVLPVPDNLTETLPALMRERGISYRQLAAQTRLLDRGGHGLSHSYLVNLAAGREIPSRRALELLASAFKLSPDYFAEYRLAELRRQLDERQVGFDAAYRTYQTLSRKRPIRSR